MDEIVLKLFDAASAARENSYSPYSNFKVGAAILDEDGNLFAGTNVEDATFKSICAEVSAISNMISKVGRKILTHVIVVAGEKDDGTLVLPCGHCRQYLREHAAPDMKVYAAGPEGLRRTFTLEELLPHSFGPENLGR